MRQMKITTELSQAINKSNDEQTMRIIYSKMWTVTEPETNVLRQIYVFVHIIPCPPSSSRHLSSSSSLFSLSLDSVLMQKQSITSCERAFLCFRWEKLCVANMKFLRLLLTWLMVLPTLNISRFLFLFLSLSVCVLFCVRFHNGGILYVKCHSKIIQQVILDEWTGEVYRTRILCEWIDVKLTIVLLDLSRRRLQPMAVIRLEYAKQHTRYFENEPKGGKTKYIEAEKKRCGDRNNNRWWKKWR